MTKKLKFIKLVPGFYAPGTTHNINEIVAEKFIKLGIATEVKDEIEPVRQVARNKAVRKAN